MRELQAADQPERAEVVEWYKGVIVADILEYNRQREAVITDGEMHPEDADPLRGEFPSLSAEGMNSRQERHLLFQLTQDAYSAALYDPQLQAALGIEGGLTTVVQEKQLDPATTERTIYTGLTADIIVAESMRINREDGLMEDYRAWIMPHPVVDLEGLRQLEDAA